MAIRAGQILHVANGFVIDRIQTAGPGNLNIPQEKVYELGNYQSVGIVRDIPDLSFSLDCLNVDTEVEGLLCGSANPTADADGTEYDLALAKTIDILSPWKSPYGNFTAVKGVAIPQLYLESASYRYGLRENAGEQFSLKGDSIFYVPGGVRAESFTGDGSTVLFSFADGPALPYALSGQTTYALAVSVNGARLFRGADYTDSTTGVTFLTAPAISADIKIVYGSVSTSTHNQSVHQGVAVKPAAIRGKDIDVYFATAIALGGGVTNYTLATNEVTLTTASAHNLTIGDVVTVNIADTEVNGTFTTIAGTTGSTIVYALTHGDITGGATTGTVTKSVEVRWPDVQSASIEWRVQLEDDMEFGNPYAVSREAATSAKLKCPSTTIAISNTIAPVIGSDSSKARLPARISTPSAASVAYATEERASELRIGRASKLGNRSESDWLRGKGLPSSRLASLNSTGCVGSAPRMHRSPLARRNPPVP